LLILITLVVIIQQQLLPLLMRSQSYAHIAYIRTRSTITINRYQCYELYKTIPWQTNKNNIWDDKPNYCISLYQSSKQV